MAVSLLFLSPSIGYAQTERARITVEWQNASLSHVVRAFATFSGRTIVIAPDVGDPEITASVQNTEWPRALDLILATRALVARVDASGVIRVEKQSPTAPTR